MRFENIRNENVIRTKGAKVSAPGSFKKQAEAVVWPPVLRVDDVLKPGVLVSLHDLSGVIRRGVVYYKQLEIAEILGQNRFNRLAQEASIVIGGNENAEQRFALHYFKKLMLHCHSNATVFVCARIRTSPREGQ